MSSVFNPANSHGNGYPLGLAGATAATRYVGATATGAPASGDFLKGDFVITQDGTVLVCTVAGSPGTWTSASSSGIPATILDAKGDIIAATAADTASRLAVGTNQTVLIADSAQATGLRWGGAVATYNPALTGSGGNPTLGAGAEQLGYYWEFGTLTIGQARVQVGGAGFANGTGDVIASLPVTAAAGPAAQILPVGAGYFYDSSAADIWVVTAFLNNTTTVKLGFTATTQRASLTYAAPVTMAQSDEVAFTFIYQNNR